MAVGIPLMVIASIATFTTMRMSMKRQTDASMANPQTAMMGKFMMYVAPVGTLFSGWVLPIAIVLYFMANNIWTLGQQHFLSNKIDREQEREKQKELAAKKDAPRPKPGQKPGQVKKAEESADAGSAADEDSEASATDASATAVNGAKATANSGGGGGNRRPQQKKRPGKQAASAKKGQKKRR